MLHTTTGFLCAATGFALIDILNRNSRIKFELSPIYVALAAFCFSMTVGVLWEFFEFGMDRLFHMDMQKDMIIHSFASVTLDPTILLHNKGNVLTTFIRSAWPGSVAPNSADQFVGYRANEGYDACNVYVQFANLPEIPQNCVPISAQLAMYNAGFFTSDGVGCAAPDGSLTVEAHEWPAAVSDVSGLTWYLVHFGSTPVNEETIDYQKLSKETLGEYVTWDITRTVMQLSLIHI